MQFVWCYIQKEALGNEIELSIASVRKFYQGEARITVVGDTPYKYDGHLIPKTRIVEKDFPRYRDVISKMQFITEHPEVDEEFVWMMDDTYFIKPVTYADLQVQRSEPVWNRSEINEWQRRKSATMDALAAQGYSTIDYATHLPHLIRKRGLRRVFEEFDVYGAVLLWENVYHNIHGTPTIPYYPFFGRILIPSDRQMIEAQVGECTIVNNSNKAWNNPLQQWLCDRIGVEYVSPQRMKPELRKVVKKPVTGLGDVVEAGLSAVGVTKHTVKRIKQRITGNPNADCNCDDRQAWLNALVPFSRE